MARFMHYDENDDGTLTVSHNLLDGVEVHTALLEMSFHDMMSVLVPLESDPAVREVEEHIQKALTVVPNSAQGAEE